MYQGKYQLEKTKLHRNIGFQDGVEKLPGQKVKQKMCLAKKKKSKR